MNGENCIKEDESMSTHYSQSEQFTNLYSMSKTLRNELIPIGKTKEWIMKEGILSEDEARAEAYKKVKAIIDDYHRIFIDRVLTTLNIEWNPLVDAIQNYRKMTDDKNKKQMTNIQASIRKQIVKCFTDSDVYKKIFGKELFSEILPSYINNCKDRTDEEKEESLACIKMFDKFSGYFNQFSENRKNIYSTDEKVGTIAYRIVHQNLLFFMDNIESYKVIVSKMPMLIEDIEKKYKDVLDGWTLAQIFSADFYNNAISQKGIAYYNEIVGYVNECSNLCCQKHDEVAKYAKIVKMKLLYKQILSNAISRFEIPDKLNSDEEAKAIVVEYSKMIEDDNIAKRVVSLANAVKDMDMEKIYIKAGEMTHISTVIYNDWGTIDTAIKAYIGENDLSKKKKAKKTEGSSQYSISQVQEIVNKYYATANVVYDKPLIEYFTYVSEKATGIDELYQKIQCLSFDKIKESSENAQRVKEYLDKYLELLHALKPFMVSNELDRCSEFYSEYDVVMSELGMIIKIYNMVRNYATMKPYSDEKVKLNFKNPTLASGWDQNKERDNTAIMLLKDDKYYLGVMNAKNKPQFAIVSESNGAYKKMVYKLLPGPNKMLPKVYFSKKGIENFNPPKEILDGYNKGKHKKGDTFDKEFCMKLIDWFKDAISRHEDWKTFNFKFSETESYQDISGFYKEIEQQGYKITYEYIKETDIDKLVEDGQLYLFQIYNKDFAKGKKGKDNLHTMYLKACFDEDNLKNVVYKLNGEAELFYRKKSIENPVIHREGTVLINKWTNEQNSKPVPDDVYIELNDFYNNGKKEISDKSKEYLAKVDTKVATYDIIKDRRYTVDKFFFHLPITINFKSKNVENINSMVCKYLKDTEDIKYIGIDRGERNLLYVTLVDNKGNIIQQKNFNIVNNYDYKEKLTLREDYRDKARKNWAEVGKIAELKEGYLSMVINQIVEMMLENNAVIIMEDLNFGFKRGRFKFERQVYQKFENMLISKLNYVVKKSVDKNEVTGLLKGLQLTSFEKKVTEVGKQCGFIFYIPAAFTSKIDPTTGFVQVFNFKKVSTLESMRAFFGEFEEIIYDAKEDVFKFTFDYDKFEHFQTLYRNKWTVSSHGDRIETTKDLKTSASLSKVVNITDRYKEVFADVPYKEAKDLKAYIEKLDNSKIKELFAAFKLMLQMRNSKAGSEEDYIISPVKNDVGEHFDSRDYQTEAGDGELPENADANGAYHIALKGKCLIESIKDLANENGEFDRKKLVMTNERWLKYMQNQEYRG